MSDYIERFFRAYQASSEPMSVVLIASTPLDMLVDPTPNKSGWVEWKLVPQMTSLEPAMLALEKEVGIGLPTSFKDWLSRYYTLDMDIAIARLPACPSNNPLGPLRERIFGSGYHSERPRALGLLPFGAEAKMDAGPLCFDTRQARADNGWPIVYWDHDFDKRPEEIGPMIFSSFAKLIECATHFLEIPKGD